MRALLLLAAFATAGLFASGPAAAAVLGRMTASRAGHSLDYRLTDAPGAASGWQQSAGKRSVLLDWQGPAPTDHLVLQLTLDGTKAVAARVALPDAVGGALSASEPEDLRVTIRKLSQQGPWLRISGRLSGTLRLEQSDAAALSRDSQRLRARFHSWVPGILAPGTAPAGSHD